MVSTTAQNETAYVQKISKVTEERDHLTEERNQLVVERNQLVVERNQLVEERTQLQQKLQMTKLQMVEQDGGAVTGHQGAKDDGADSLRGMLGELKDEMRSMKTSIMASIKNRSHVNGRPDL